MMPSYSLRARILLLLFPLLLPVLFFLIYMFHEQRQTAIVTLERDIKSNMRILAELVDQKLEGSRALLISLAHSPALRNRDSAACHKLLAGILQESPRYTNLGAADSDGNVFCSALPMAEPVNAADKTWFQRTIKTQDIAYGDYQIGRIIGRPVLIMGKAARDASGGVQAAIFAPFDLYRLSKLPEEVNLPQGMVFFILDRNGTILSRSPDHEIWVGKTLPECNLIKTILTQSAGSIETEGVDGRKRFYSFTAIANTNNSIFICIGISKDIAFEKIKRQFIQNLTLFGILVCLSVVAALLISRLARQSEANLVESEARFRNLAENASDMICRRSLVDDRYEYVSPTSIKLLGYFPEEFYASPTLMRQLIHPDWQGYVREQEENFKAGVVMPAYEYRIIHKSGEVKWLLQKNVLIMDDKGQPCAVQGILSDITMRKQVEEKLRQSEQYNRMLFESSPIGLALCRMDGTLVDINSAYATIIGRTVAETLQLTYWDITPQHYFKQEQAHLKSLEETGRYGPYEKEYIHRDGHLVPVRLQGLLIENNGEKFIWSSIEDISERKNAEKALQRNEHLLMLFVEHSPAAIAMFDNEMKYIVASRRFLMDYNLGDQNVIGRSHYELFPEIPEHWREIHRHCLAGAVEKSDEDPFPRADGKTDWVRWEIRPWYETRGQIGGIILFSEVITQRKQSEEEIKTINEELLAINRIIAAITGVSSIHEILEKVMDDALAITGLEGGTICMVTPENTLQLAVHRKTSEATILDLTTNEIQIGDCLCGQCARDHKPFILSDREAVLKYAPREATRGEDIRFHAAFPIITAGRCLGVLCVFTRTDKKPEKRRLKILETVSSQIALAVQNAGLFEASLRNAAVLEEKVKERTAEFEQKIAEIKRLNRIFVGRELRMKELKAKIRKLEKENSSK